jgi:MFS family permease
MRWKTLLRQNWPCHQSPIDFGVNTPDYCPETLQRAGNLSCAANPEQEMHSSLGTPRAALMAVFAAFGAIFGTFSGSVPQLVANYGLNNASYGLGITMMVAATVCAMSLSGFMARHFSHRHLLVVLLPLTFGLMAALFTATEPALFYILATLLGFASGALDVIMNAEGGQIEVDMQRPVYMAFHGSVSLSVAVFAILSSLLSTNFGTHVSILAASTAVIAAIVLVSRNVPIRTVTAITNQGARPDLRAAFTRPLFIIGLCAGLVISVEVTALLWSSKLLAETAPQFAAISGLGAAFFGLCNALVRFPSDGLRARFGDLHVMMTSVWLAIIGFAGLGLTTSFASNVFFFALVGMGVALLAPSLLAMAARETPRNRAAGISVAMLIAGAPRIVAPRAFGEIAEMFSTRVAFGLCAVLLVGAFLFMNTLRVMKRSSTEMTGSTTANSM